LRMRSRSATDVPPNFMTSRAMRDDKSLGCKETPAAWPAPARYIEAVSAPQPGLVVAKVDARPRHERLASSAVRS
jgi:hypothetical protein